MLSKSKSIAGSTASSSSAAAPPAGSGPQQGGYKKKKAPPRPPPPSSAKSLSSSQSFHTSSDLFSSQNQRRSAFAQKSSYSVDVPTSNNQKSDDLILLATPPGSPTSLSNRRSIVGPPKPKGPPDFMYRVGASVFYVKSELKHSTSATPAANPFSPPRPSAQSILSSSASPVKQQSSPYTPSSALYGNIPSTSSTYHNNNNNSISKLDGGRNSFRSSSGSSDWSDFSQQSQNKLQPQQRYGNIPNIPQVPITTWDEPPAQHAKTITNPPITTNHLPVLHETKPQVKPQVLQMPMIIKPQTSNKPSLLPKPSLKAKLEQQGFSSSIINNAQASVDNDNNGIHARNYYDDPPDSDFDDDDDFNEEDDSYVSPPMPSEPPPPPPTDVAVDEWVDSAAKAPAYHEPEMVNQNVETDRAYAIALYDYIPDVDGDLPLQAGDLVYLYRKVDDAWLYGQCAGYEGMFPSSFVNIVVPLPEEETVPAQAPAAVPAEPIQSYPTAQVLYQFDAETESDLTLTPGDTVSLYGRLNEDWLYGECGGVLGQFPSAFVSPVPSDLPTIGNLS